MTREYHNDTITVLWDAERCIHFGNCVRSLPGVFKSDASPWIDLAGADADEVARVVMGCPSGALHFRRRDGGPAEQPAEPTIVMPVPDGPLYVRGDIEVLAPDGTVLRRDTRVALCRCGGSANKPFCDLSHRTNGFTTED
jgi:uncharacterized Fe-S cluster protein YjdI